LRWPWYPVKRAMDVSCGIRESGITSSARTGRGFRFQLRNPTRPAPFLARRAGGCLGFWIAATVLIVLCSGFSSGLAWWHCRGRPLLVWLRESGVRPSATIGLSRVGTPPHTKRLMMCEIWARCVDCVACAFSPAGSAPAGAGWLVFLECC